MFNIRKVAMVYGWFKERLFVGKADIQPCLPEYPDQPLHYARHLISARQRILLGIVRTNPGATLKRNYRIYRKKTVEDVGEQTIRIDLRILAEKGLVRIKMSYRYQYYPV